MVKEQLGLCLADECTLNFSSVMLILAVGIMSSKVGNETTSSTRKENSYAHNLLHCITL